MKTPTLSPRDRRALIVAVVAIGGMLLVGRALPAARRWKADTEAGAREIMAEVARADMSLRNLPALLDSLEARNARVADLAPALFGGDTPAAAGSSLASWVSGAAARTNAQLGAVYVQSDTGRAGAFLRVAVRGDLTTDVAGLTEFLLEVERGPTLLSVTDLSIDQPGPGLDDDRMEALRVRFTVEGLALQRPDLGETQ